MIYNNLKIELDDNAKYIIDTLNGAGYEAYAVGGCVRDFLLKSNATDYDITTNAKPLEIKKLFKKTVDTGIEHGTVSVIFYDKNHAKNYEVTTYRIDGKYLDNRHPNEVLFVENLIEDLKRRDFTINAFAYNDKAGLIDEFDGIKDLQNRSIRTVGEPSKRYTEDALRMLRAIRFSSQLDFTIEENSYNSIKQLNYLLKNISKERIAVELLKLLTGKKPENVKFLFETGLDKYICNDFNKINYLKSYNTNNNIIALSSLLYDLNTDTKDFNDLDCKHKILKELKYDNDTITNTIKVLSYKNLPNNLNNIDLKKMVNCLGYDLIFDALKLYSIKENKNFDNYKKIIQFFKNNNECIYLKQLKINGSDLKQLGYSGKQIGIILNKLLDLVYENNNKNDYDILLREVKNGEL